MCPRVRVCQVSVCSVRVAAASTATPLVPSLRVCVCGIPCSLLSMRLTHDMLRNISTVRSNRCKRSPTRLTNGTRCAE
eukprot:scaffold10789_cov141-Isochrysis_galbana.AAC.10